MTNGQQVRYYDEKAGFWVSCHIISFTPDSAIIGTRNGHYRRQVLLTDLRFEHYVRVSW